MHTKYHKICDTKSYIFTLMLRIHFTLSQLNLFFGKIKTHLFLAHRIVQNLPIFDILFMYWRCRKFMLIFKTLFRGTNSIFVIFRICLNRYNFIKHVFLRTHMEILYYKSLSRGSLNFVFTFCFLTKYVVLDTLFFTAS